MVPLIPWWGWVIIVCIAFTMVVIGACITMAVVAYRRQTQEFDKFDNRMEEKMRNRGW